MASSLSSKKKLNTVSPDLATLSAFVAFFSSLNGLWLRTSTAGGDLLNGALLHIKQGVPSPPTQWRELWHFGNYWTYALESAAVCCFLLIFELRLTHAKPRRQRLIEALVIFALFDWSSGNYMVGWRYPFVDIVWVGQFFWTLIASFVSLFLFIGMKKLVTFVDVQLRFPS